MERTSDTGSDSGALPFNMLYVEGSSGERGNLTECTGMEEWPLETKIQVGSRFSLKE